MDGSINGWSYGWMEGPISALSKLGLSLLAVCPCDVPTHLECSVVQGRVAIEHSLIFLPILILTLPNPNPI
jgi:hypothetical protein